MHDIVIEFVRLLVVLFLLRYLFKVGRQENLRQERGWRFILGGFTLILFGMLLDLSDNFTSLNKFVVVGDTVVEAYLEKLVGYLAGYILLTVGFTLWIPQVIENDKLKVALQRETRNLNQEIEAHQKEEQLRLAAEEKLQRANKMEAIGLLAGGVAHDLNNMLTGIVGYPTLILQDENLPPQHRKRLIAIRDTGARIADVVSDMQVLSRSSAANREIVGLNRVIEGYLLSPEFAEKNTACQVRLATDLDPGLPTVMGKGHHLRKVIMNLLINAMEAAGEEGGVEIGTSAQSLATPLAGYETIPAGDYLRLRITDSGHGIDPEAIGRIFEPFFSKKVMGASGSGLGLATCWTIVHDHGGYFDLHSDDSGSVFDVYLPVSEQAAQPETEPLDLTPVPHGGGETVIVVDDEAVARQVTTAMLETLGYQVLVAESGEAAVAMLGQRKVELVLLDMVMAPGISGLETLRRILELHPGQKAIILSGQAETEEVAEVRRLGADLFLRKPIELKSLAMAVAAELQRPVRIAP